MEKAKTDIGKRFKDARKIAGKSQQVVADDLGVTTATVRNWEHERAKCTRYNHLAYYASISGYTIDYLQGLVDDPQGSFAVKYFAERYAPVHHLIEYLNIASPYYIQRIESTIPIYEIYDKSSKELVRRLVHAQFLSFSKSLNDMIVAATQGMVETTTSERASRLDWTRGSHVAEKKRFKEFVDAAIDEINATYKHTINRSE